MTHYAGVLRVGQPGHTSRSRAARKRGQVAKAKRLEKEARKRHREILDRGFIWQPGCHRYFLQSNCLCSKCKKKRKRQEVWK